MDEKERGLVKVSCEVYNISEKSRLDVLEYTDKKYKIDELLNIVNKNLRKEKLLSIEEKNV